MSKEPDKVLTIMQMVMKSAEKVARERPDFGLDPNMPQVRKEHPEWFEDEDPNQCDCAKCDLKRKGLWK